MNLNWENSNKAISKTDEVLNYIDRLEHLGEYGKLNYYRIDDILFQMNHFSENYTLDFVKERIIIGLATNPERLNRYFNGTSLPMLKVGTDYVDEEFGFRNLSIWEYDKFINNIENPDKALKSAFISEEDNYFVIICEPYDSESNLTEKNLRIIENRIKELKAELIKLTKKELESIQVFN